MHTDEIAAEGKFLIAYYTVCPRSRDSFYIVSYYKNWVTTSWTCSIFKAKPGQSDQLTIYQT